MSLVADVLNKTNRILVKGGIKHSGWSVFPQESGLAFRLETHLGDGLVGLLVADAMEETTGETTI